jgi:hypothetical protein
MKGHTVAVVAVSIPVFAVLVATAGPIVAALVVFLCVGRALS